MKTTEGRATFNPSTGGLVMENPEAEYHRNMIALLEIDITTCEKRIAQLGFDSKIANVFLTNAQTELIKHRRALGGEKQK